MRLGKAAVFGIVAGTITIGFATPAMADTGEVIVKPGHVRPGDKVTVVGKKCEVHGKAGSLAFQNGSTPLNGAEEVDGRAGLATVKADTVPGTYTVQVICGAHKSVGQFVVVDAKAAPKTHKTPSGGAETGFGGGADGANTVFLAGGGVLILGAAGVGAMAVRRRNDAGA
jgi:hypothetical protein